MHYCSVIKYVDFLFDLPGHHTEAWVELYICYWTLQDFFINIYLGKNTIIKPIPLVHPNLSKLSIT